MTDAIHNQQSEELRSPKDLRRRVTELARDRKRLLSDSTKYTRHLAKVKRFLENAPKVADALDQLSKSLFEQTVGLLQEKLTIALQEVLEQPIKLRADSTFRYGSANVDFYIERDGHHEDIMQGQGGSVTNVLSVGLRMFALTTLDPARHRRVLILDEQDCWLRPDLVPKLVKIVHDAGEALGFQVLMVSHHDVTSFMQFADRIYRFIPENGVTRCELVEDMDQ